MQCYIFQWQSHEKDMGNFSLEAMTYSDLTLVVALINFFDFGSFEESRKAFIYVHQSSLLPSSNSRKSRRLLNTVSMDLSLFNLHPISHSKFSRSSLQYDHGLPRKSNCSLQVPILIKSNFSSIELYNCTLRLLACC